MNIVRLIGVVLIVLLLLDCMKAHLPHVLPALMIYDGRGSDLLGSDDSDDFGTAPKRSIVTQIWEQFTNMCKHKRWNVARILASEDEKRMDQFGSTRPEKIETARSAADSQRFEESVIHIPDVPMKIAKKISLGNVSGNTTPSLESAITPTSNLSAPSMIIDLSETLERERTRQPTNSGLVQPQFPSVEQVYPLAEQRRESR